MRPRLKESILYLMHDPEGKLAYRGLRTDEKKPRDFQRNNKTDGFLTILCSNLVLVQELPLTYIIS